MWRVGDVLYRPRLDAVIVVEEVFDCRVAKCYVAGKYLRGFEEFSKGSKARWCTDEEVVKLADAVVYGDTLVVEATDG